MAPHPVPPTRSGAARRIHADHQRRPSRDLARAPSCRSCSHAASARAGASALLGSASTGAARSSRLPDDELWEAHLAQTERLGRFLRSRLRDQFARHGARPTSCAASSTLFDADALTIGFARRFATYKRAEPRLLRPPPAAACSSASASGRCRSSSPARRIPPTGRARSSSSTSSSSRSRTRFRGRVFFVEDYDMRVGRDAGAGRRRLAQHAAPAAGSVGHLGAEGGDERRAQPARSPTAGGPRASTARTAG